MNFIFGRIAKQNPVFEMVSSFRPSVCLSVCPTRQQFGLALAFKFIQNDHWQHLCQTSHLDRPSTHCDLCLWPCPWKFQVSRSNLLLRLSSFQNDHWQYLFQTSHVDRPWWLLPIETFVCDLDLWSSKFQGQIFYWRLTSLYLDHCQ